jgi:hypothetical protein
MLTMFLDESGDHNLAVIDPQYPVFVLGGVIADSEYAVGEMTTQVRQFKLSVFGRDDLVLHTADIARNKNGFERLKEPDFRSYFYENLNALMSRLEYKVVACAIKKDVHAARYGIAALDPYMLSLRVLVERFCYEIGGVEHGGQIVVERRDPVLDRQLELAWTDLTIRGTDFVSPSRVRRRIDGLVMRSKQECLAGLELADLVVSPIGRFVLGRPIKEDFRIIESKFRQLGRGYQGPGLVVLPK